MNNDSKIITLDKIVNPSRQARRHPEQMVKQLMQDKKLLIETVANLNSVVGAMNKLLTKIAEAVGTPVPKGDANDAECIKQLFAKLEELSLRAPS